MEDSEDLVKERRGTTTRSRYKLTPACYVERVTIRPECGDIIVRGTATIWEALLNSVHEYTHSGNLYGFGGYTFP